MGLSSRVKLVSAFGLVLTVVASLTFFGASRGISHASGTFQQSFIQAESNVTTTTSSCESWQPVPVQYPPMYSGNYGFDGVAAIAPNNVWAVGDFTEHWDGTRWSKVAGGGLNGIAALSANNIWAVGGVANVDGASWGKALIKHWNGTRWGIVPGANLGSIASQLNAVAAISTNNIWAVGGDSNGTLIEHWNGSIWSIVTNPTMNLPNNELTSISALSANDIWTVGGTVWFPAGIQHQIIEHWNGKVWSIIPSPNPSVYTNPTGVTAISANNVWAVGDGGIEHWNGKEWSIVPNPAGGTLEAVTAISANNIWAVGTLAEHWNGSSWSIANTGISGSEWDPVWAVAKVPHTNTLWAVGTYWMGDYSNPLTEFYC